MLSRGEAVYAALFHGRVGFKIDGVVPRLVFGETM